MKIRLGLKIKRSCLFLFVSWLGWLGVPSNHRRWLRLHQASSDSVTKRSPVTLRQAKLIPWRDLLNRPSGGQAYCGGVLFDDPLLQPELRQWRGTQSIDTPLFAKHEVDVDFFSVPGRLFWCGPLAFHFGHQIADFATRVLMSSLDPRDGTLLWYPWKSSNNIEDLLPWQQFLLKYLNPGFKPYWISTIAIKADELVVYPQQAPMRDVPSPSYLQALNWCERKIRPILSDVIYISRSRFSPCISAETLLGGFAAEALFEKMLIQRGVRIVYPEMMDLEEQLAIYRGAQSIIISEGSAQHGLELLGYQGTKPLIIICRRPQILGMDLPLKARFPDVKFVVALVSHWVPRNGVAWNGIAMLDWFKVSSFVNPLLNEPLNTADCIELKSAADSQLLSLKLLLPLYQSS